MRAARSCCGCRGWSLVSWPARPPPLAIRRPRPRPLPRARKPMWARSARCSASEASGMPPPCRRPVRTASPWQALSSPPSPSWARPAFLGVNCAPSQFWRWLGWAWPSSARCHLGSLPSPWNTSPARACCAIPPSSLSWLCRWPSRESEPCATYPPRSPCVPACSKPPMPRRSSPC